ncbi:BspA family leucine-rich repeat surface protein [Cellulosimicrobium marinum]|uniref:BspA family leucine-rich repeat surface protein n=1 Tax=Cellulosimicrobium marinum TaxID=1638992 RepID=UPI001E562BD0|nr:BspA family leucine-rich repeat surface protein [Cellulosimicrobium marinum]MCB7137271.1 BspA family leucine-rich repeat surface protein [Cellulosimicrobium marinum]
MSRTRRPHRARTGLLVAGLASALAVVVPALPAQAAGWGASVSLGTSTATGALAIDADTLATTTWTDEGGAVVDPTTVPLTAGSTVTTTVAVPVTAAGENLEATFVTSGGVQVPADVADHVSVDVTADPVLGASSAPDGTQTVDLAVTVAADAALPAGEHVVDLSSLAVTLTNGHGWSDTAVVDAGTVLVGEPEPEPDREPGVLRMNVDTSKTADDTVTIYLTSPDATIDWGDGTVEDAVDGANTHTYTQTSSTLSVKVTGTFAALGSPEQSVADVEEIAQITEWTATGAESAAHALQNAVNVLSVNEIPETVTDLSFMFAGATSFNGWSIAELDLSHVTTTAHMFDGATSFNVGLQDWDVSTVQDMTSMFEGATAFNQDLSGWDVSSATTMDRMFAGASRFGQDLSGWDVAHVTSHTDFDTGSALTADQLPAWPDAARDAQDDAATEPEPQPDGTDGTDGATEEPGDAVDPEGDGGTDTGVGTEPDGTDPGGTDPDGTDPDGTILDGTNPDGTDPDEQCTAPDETEAPEAEIDDTTDGSGTADGTPCAALAATKEDER